MEKERSKKQNLSAKHERLKNQQMYFLEVHVAKSGRINYPIILFFFKWLILEPLHYVKHRIQLTLSFSF